MIKVISLSHVEFAAIQFFSIGK